MADSVLTPTPKVSASALVGAVVLIVTWVVNTVWHLDLPVEVGSLAQLVLMVAAGYLKKDTTKTTS